MVYISINVRMGQLSCLDQGVMEPAVSLDMICSHWVIGICMVWCRMIVAF